MIMSSLEIDTFVIILNLSELCRIRGDLEKVFWVLFWVFQANSRFRGRFFVDLEGVWDALELFQENAILQSQNKLGSNFCNLN